MCRRSFRPLFWNKFLYFLHSFFYQAHNVRMKDLNIPTNTSKKIKCCNVRLIIYFDKSECELNT